MLGEFDDWSTSYCERVGVCGAEFDDGSESESVCRTLAEPGTIDRPADSKEKTSMGGYTCGRCCCAYCSSFSALLILAELGVLEADRRFRRSDGGDQVVE